MTFKELIPENETVSAVLRVSVVKIKLMLVDYESFPVDSRGLSTLGADPHVEANPLYGELREKGIAVSTEQRVPLPEPTIADGIDGAT